MSVIQVDQVGQTSLDRASKILAGVQGGAWKAVHGAMKRAGDTAKTKAGQFAAEEYTINKGDFARNVTVSTSLKGDSGGIVSMDIKYAGHVLPLLTFNTRFSRDGHITTQVKRNGGSETLQRAFAERVFGPIGVFERKGASRFPVEQKYGPSTAHMMMNERVIEKMDETIRETFERRIEHEITRILNGWGAKS